MKGSQRPQSFARRCMVSLSSCKLPRQPNQGSGSTPTTTPRSWQPSGGSLSGKPVGAENSNEACTEAPSTADADLVVDVSEESICATDPDMPELDMIEPPFEYAGPGEPPKVYRRAPEEPDSEEEEQGEEESLAVIVEHIGDGKVHDKQGEHCMSACYCAGQWL